MSSRSRYEQLAKFKEAWASEIAKKDSDYQDYAGASLEDALRLARIDTLLYILPKKHKLRILLKFLRVYLIQKRKAVFASVGMGEMSKLGALKARSGVGEYHTSVFKENK